jgi:large subunit ribosomal protein L24
MRHIHIRKDDIVVVLTGDDKGKRGRVLKIHTKTGKVLVEGINKVYKHLKPSRQNTQGGRLSKEMPIDLSNVALIDPSTNKPTRVGVRYLPDGSKERYAKKSGTALSKIAPANPKYAKK